MQRYLLFLCDMEIRRLANHCRRPVDGVTESDAWKDCCEKFPEYCKDYRNEYSFVPYNRDRVFLIGDPLRHVFLSTLPGVDEKDKFNRLFKSASPWLIWFTFADYTAKVLDLNLPDLSTVTGFERSKDIFHRWWGLPESAFECRPWPDGTDGEPLSRTDLRLLGLGTRQDAPITNRERKRALANSARSKPIHDLDWPTLPSVEWLQLDFKTRTMLLRKAGHLGGEESRHPEFCGIDVTRRRGSIDY